MTFRLLKPCEINVKVKTVTSNDYALALLYKDARTDMTLLDETVGTENWETSYREVGNVLYCSIKVWDEKKQMWISKESNGTESDMEKEKGEASDALKRAGFMWGIGRELYTSPSVLIKVDPKEKNPKGNGVSQYTKFHVSEIGYNDIFRSITHLVIKDQNGKQRFKWDSKTLKTTKMVGNDIEENMIDSASVVDDHKQAEPTQVFESAKKVEPVQEPKQEQVAESKKDDGMLYPIFPFSPSTVWLQISEAVGEELAKTAFKECGANSKKEITVPIYTKVLELVNQGLGKK